MHHFEAPVATTEETGMKSTEICDEEFELLFDAGEDISDFVDWENARQPGLEITRLNMDIRVRDGACAGQGSVAAGPFPANRNSLPGRATE